MNRLPIRWLLLVLTVFYGAAYGQKLQPITTGQKPDWLTQLEQKTNAQPPGAPYYGGLLVMPLINETTSTGGDDIRWALFSSMIRDMRYVPGWTTLLKGRVSRAIALDCPELEKHCVDKLDAESVIYRLRDRKQLDALLQAMDIEQFNSVLEAELINHVIGGSYRVKGQAVSLSLYWKHIKPDGSTITVDHWAVQSSTSTLLTDVSQSLVERLEKLGINLNKHDAQSLVSVKTHNRAALIAYGQGIKQFLLREASDKHRELAVEYLQNAVRHDENFAEAWVSLAQASFDESAPALYILPFRIAITLKPFLLEPVFLRSDTPDDIAQYESRWINARFNLLPFGVLGPSHADRAGKHESTLRLLTLLQWIQAIPDPETRDSLTTLLLLGAIHSDQLTNGVEEKRDWSRIALQFFERNQEAIDPTWRVAAEAYFRAMLFKAELVLENSAQPTDSRNLAGAIEQLLLYQPSSRESALLIQGFAEDIYSAALGEVKKEYFPYQLEVMEAFFQNRQKFISTLISLSISSDYFESWIYQKLRHQLIDAYEAMGHHDQALELIRQSMPDVPRYARGGPIMNAVMLSKEARLLQSSGDVQQALNKAKAAWELLITSAQSENAQDEYRRYSIEADIGKVGHVYAALLEISGNPQLGAEIAEIANALPQLPSYGG